MTDAHNHLQQLPHPSQALAEAQSKGITRMLVNGTSEEDWPAVAELYHNHPQVLPSFGLHPWNVPTRSHKWLATLRQFLNEHSTAALGECGLDRWKKPFDLPDQLSCLQAQIDLARELQRPLTIHCLQAWGPLLELLQSQSSLPPFLLHAYSGSTEMVAPFAQLGAYFSFSGYFLHEHKTSVRETYRHIPLDRLLLESDAPAMLPPSTHQTFPSNQNHPGNLAAFLPALAKIRPLEQAALLTQIESNFENFHNLKPQR